MSTIRVLLTFYRKSPTVSRKALAHPKRQCKEYYLGPPLEYRKKYYLRGWAVRWTMAKISASQFLGTGFWTRILHSYVKFACFPPRVGTLAPNLYLYWGGEKIEWCYFCCLSLNRVTLPILYSRKDSMRSETHRQSCKNFGLICSLLSPKYR